MTNPDSRDRNKREHFMRYYDIRLLDDSQRVRKYRAPNIHWSKNSGVSEMQTTFDTEQLLTVQIPESRMQSLLELDEWFYRNSGGQRPRDLFTDFWEEQKMQEQFRERNPAVKNAYEQYLTLLKLAGFDN